MIALTACDRVEGRAEGKTPGIASALPPSSQPSPLKQWMKANAAPAMSAEDASALGHAFRRIEAMGSPDYPEWKTISQAGVRAAALRDMEGCRHTCKRCHDAYRERYRATMRERPSTDGASLLAK